MVIHQNGAPQQPHGSRDVTPLCAEADLSVAVSSQSTLDEFTPWGCGGETPAAIACEMLTRRPTHGEQLGWLGGILWPFSVLALSPMARGLGAGKGVSSIDDEGIC